MDKSSGLKKFNMLRQEQVNSTSIVNKIIWRGLELAIMIEKKFWCLNKNWEKENPVTF